MKGTEKITSILEHTKLPTIHIAVASDKVVTCIDSKFGGCFYMPKGKTPPSSLEYGEMEFLAQLNFAQLPPIKRFPEKGILQFFLCTNVNAVEEMETVELSSNGHFKVVYYPEVDDEISSHTGQIYETRWPMEKLAGGMIFESTSEIATLSLGEEGFRTDFGYDDVSNLLNEKLIQEIGYDLSDCSDTDRFCADFGNWGCKIGGHPAIRQGDVRTEEEGLQVYTDLLFQFDLTSKDELEADTFVFVIKPEDLVSCQFDDVLLYWHNCF